MTLWGKAFALLMSLGFVFSATACGINNGSSTNDGKNSGNQSDASDNLDDSSDDSSDDGSDDGSDDSSGKQELGDKENYLDAILSALKESKSMTVEGSISYSMEAEANDYAEEREWSGTAQLTESANDFGMDMKAWYNYLPEGYPEQFEQKRTFYVIGDHFYGNTDYLNRNDVYDNTYYKYGETVEDVINDKARMLGIYPAVRPATFANYTEQIKEALFGLDLERFVQSAEVKNGKFMVGIDFADYINEKIAFVLEEHTFGEMADEILSDIHAEFTCEELLEVFAESGDKTLQKAYTDMEALFEEKYGMTVQNVYDSIVSNEQILDFIVMYVTDMQEFHGEEVTDEEIEEFIERLQDVDIASGIDSEKTVNEYFAEIFEYEFDMEPYTTEEIVEYAQSYLETSLSDVVEDWDFVEEILNGIEVKEFSISFGADFDGEEVENIAVELDFDMAMPSANDNGMNGQGTVKANAELTFSELSNKRNRIELPATANIRDYGYRCQECGNRNQSVRHRNDYYGKLCDDCYNEWRYEECARCGVHNETVAWRSEQENYYCDNCYEIKSGIGLVGKYEIYQVREYNNATDEWVTWQVGDTVSPEDGFVLTEDFMSLDLGESGEFCLTIRGLSDGSNGGMEEYTNTLVGTWNVDQEGMLMLVVSSNDITLENEPTMIFISNNYKAGGASGYIALMRGQKMSNQDNWSVVEEVVYYLRLQ